MCQHCDNLHNVAVAHSEKILLTKDKLQYNTPLTKQTIQRVRHHFCLYCDIYEEKKTKQLFYVLLIGHNTISWLRTALLLTSTFPMVTTGPLRCKTPRNGFFFLNLLTYFNLFKIVENWQLNYSFSVMRCL